MPQDAGHLFELIIKNKMGVYQNTSKVTKGRGNYQKIGGPRRKIVKGTVNYQKQQGERLIMVKDRRNYKEVGGAVKKICYRMSQLLKNKRVNP